VLVLALPRVAIQWAVLALGAVPSPQLLFTLGRSTNANVVEYSARPDASGRLAGARPFDVRWRMLATDGHVEGLNFFEERLAYGLSSRSLAHDTYELRLVSCPDRKIVVRRIDDVYRAETEIGGVASTLVRIFVRATEGPLGPKVIAVELSGASLRDGAPTFERMVPKATEASADRYETPQ
jgi:hypothetical protein